MSAENKTFVRDIKIKDVYDMIQTGKMNKYKFRHWLSFYGHKHWSKGYDYGFDLGSAPEDFEVFKAYWDGEEGKIKISNEFDHHHTVARADFLQDVLVELEEIYDKTVQEI